MDKIVEARDEVTVRFAGDSGDGIQVAGTLFSDTSGIMGNEVNTFPDYPSEIRAPEGTLYGVSAFQIHFGSKNINTTGDFIDVLVAMNASSLKVNLGNLQQGGIIIANSEGFDAKNLSLAGYQDNPLLNGALKEYKLHQVDMAREIKTELAGQNIPPKILKKSKNLFALGMTYWIFDRPLEPTVKWINKKFKGQDDVILTNVKVLNAGWKYAAETPEFTKQYKIEKADLAPGRYRNITGNHAVALGLVAAARKARLPLFLGSYPITPATDILQDISGFKKYGVKHLQAEDEIAGMCSAIGAAYGGSLAATSTSGPGLSLKTEAIGLAIMIEVPVVIINVMRAGPSTGMPTKPEQSDLYHAMFGRHGDAPLPVLAASSATDCFAMTIEAARIAVKYMTPVILLTDGYIGQATEPWRIPDMKDLPDLQPSFVTNPEGFAPYMRNPETLARPWAIPGIQGLEHRVGGLEKEDVTGDVSQEPGNHQRMTELRRDKIERIALDIPQAVVEGEQNGDVLLLSWGSTYGAAKTAFDTLHRDGKNISFLNLKYLHPMPSNLESILNRFKKILIPEMNLGQLKMVIQAKYLVPVDGLHKVQGKPFKANEIENKLREML
ncbi:MAG TPA: 2-oxoacid:acceptor oxidoreductase subunit alpha [Cyclobacteriaceae bacterium]|nr:2-oxoacid:acceptor oxidoreductase subunit alpha [Cyclobacteriaceae bacterium]